MSRSDSFGGSQSDLVFRDGKRSVGKFNCLSLLYLIKNELDFVLVFLDEAEKNKKEIKNETFRKKFIENIAKAGLETEEEYRVRKEDTKFVFIKIHVPWDKMCEYAEILNFRSPIEVQTIKEVEGSEKFFQKLRIPNIMSQTVPNEPTDYYTTPFRKSKLNRYIGYENQAEFFSKIERIRVAYEILSSTVFGRRSKAQIGIDRMVKENIFLAAYPLHDGPYKIDSKEKIAPEKLNKRQVLHAYWSQWRNWYKYQPLEHIREYFGEKIAFYFAWLGFYTTWLLPASVVGIIVFAYGVLSMSSDEPTRDLCESGENYTMCPNCEKELGCKRWYLSSICMLAKASFIADSPGSVFYAAFICLWTITFLQCWKRKSAVLAHRWNCMDFEEEAEKPRPEFVVKAPHMEKNPITGVVEPHFPPLLRKKRVLAGSGVLVMMASLVIIFIVAVIFYRMVITLTLFKVESLRGKSAMIASTTGAVLNLIFIMTMSRVYERLAHKLTTWEMHRTQTEFEDHYTFKVFIFQFINFYGSIFYIAFFKGRFRGYPGNYAHLFGYRQEACGSGSCLIELAQQLFVIMVGKQIINNTQETVIPKLKAWWHRKKTDIDTESEFDQKSRVEKDFLLIPNEGLFQEYLEMIIQFGFITIFVASF
ncbi:anoctamin-7-like protein, partial [Leptotrombidium deliense]